MQKMKESMRMKKNCTDDLGGGDLSASHRHTLEYPYTKETQEKMREVDGSKYDSLIDLISDPDDDEKCEHG